MSDEEFVYVSSVEGHHVTRPGSGTRAVKPGTIGVRWDPKRKRLVWDTEDVIRIPMGDWQRYRKEYGKAVSSGALTVRTKADFDARQREIARQAEAAQEAAREAAQDGAQGVSAEGTTEGEPEAPKPSKRRTRAKSG